MPLKIELNVQIRLLPNQGQGYPVYVTISPSQQEFKGWFISPEIVNFKMIGNHIQFGHSLFQHLFPPDQPQAQEAWNNLKNKACRFKFDLTDTSNLQPICWELLCSSPDYEHFIAATPTTPFSRYVPDTVSVLSAIEQPPLTILVAIANPSDLNGFDLSTLNVDLEQQIIQDAFKHFDRTQIRYEFLDSPISLSKLEAKLQEQPYHCLHLIAHGATSHRMKQFNLYLANDDNKVELISVTQFISMLIRQSNKPHFVFLANCHSGNTDVTYGNLALELIKEAKIPTVLAMQNSVSINTMQEFTQEFYQRLCQHGFIDMAVNEARSTLITKEYLDSIVPILFSRLPDNRLIDFAPLIPKSNYIMLSYGTMPPNSQFYIEREVDKICWYHFNQNPANTIIIQGAQATGKSSLIQQMIYRLRQEDINHKIIEVDFQETFSQQVLETNETEFFRQFCHQISDGLNLSNIDEYWDGQWGDNKVKLTRFMELYIIPSIAAPFVLVMDETQLMLNSPFGVNFFSLLRTWCNKRAVNPLFAKMTLLIGFSDEANLVRQEPILTPFNFGTSFTLQDFTRLQVETLLEKYPLSLNSEEIDSIVSLTGGHPLLTRIALDTLSTRPVNLNTLINEIGSRNSPFNFHLSRFHHLLIKQPELINYLKLVCLDKNSYTPDSSIFYRLEGAGVLKSDKSKVVFRNELYRRYFAEKLGVPI